MWLARRLALLVLAIIFTSCEFIRPPTAIDLGDSPVAVHAVLTTGSDLVRVLVTRAAPGPPAMQWPEVGPGVVPISDAEVWLMAAGDSVRLEEAPAGVASCLGIYGSPVGADTIQKAGRGCYAARIPGGVRAGIEYSLAIRLKGGGTISGTTVAPEVPSLLAPEPHARVAIRTIDSPGSSPDAVNVRFTATADVGGIKLDLRPIAAFKDGRRMDDARCGIAMDASAYRTARVDTASLQIFGVGCQHPTGNGYERLDPDSVHAQLYLTAVDARLMRYREAMQQKYVTAQAASEGISGALGLFAGAATVQRPITIIPAP